MMLEGGGAADMPGIGRGFYLLSGDNGVAPAPLRRPGRPPVSSRSPADNLPSIGAAGDNGSVLSAPESNSVDPTWSELRSDSAEFVPGRPWLSRSAQANDHEQQFSRDSSETDGEEFTSRHFLVALLCTDLAEPKNKYQKMVHDSIADVLCSLTQDPSSFDALVPSMIDDLTSWLPESVITTDSIVSWLFNQTACVPSFVYTCARLCTVFSSRLVNVKPTFRDSLLQRCSRVFDGASALLDESVDGFGQVLLLFSELYRQCDSDGRLNVLSQAVLALLNMLIQSHYSPPEQLPPLIDSLSLVGACLNVDNSGELAALMTRLDKMVSSAELPPPLQQRADHLLARHKSKWTDTQTDDVINDVAALSLASDTNPEADVRRYVAHAFPECCWDEEDNRDEIDAAYEQFLLQLDQIKR